MLATQRFSVAEGNAVNVVAAQKRHWNSHIENGVCSASKMGER